MKVKTLLACLMLSSLFVSIAYAVENAFPLKKVKKAEWTVVGFLNGDNSLASSVRLLLRKCEVHTGSDENTNVLLLYDGAKSKTLLEWSGTKLFYVKKDPNADPKDPFAVRTIKSPYLDMGELDMGSAKTVENLLCRVFRDYPAKKTMFIFVAHGTGTSGTMTGESGSFSPDDTSNSGMTAKELGNAIKRAIDQENGGRKINFSIIFSCMSNAMAINYEFSDLFGTSVGSPEEITMFGAKGSGMDGIQFWEAIQAVKEDPRISEAKLARRLIDVSADSYRRVIADLKSRDSDPYMVNQLAACIYISLSAVNLQEMDRFKNSFRRFSDILKARLEDPSTKSKTANVLSQASSQARHYAGLAMIDFPGFLAQAEKGFHNDEEVTLATQKLRVSLRSLVFYKRNEQFVSNGGENSMSIFMPHPIMAQSMFDRYIAYFKTFKLAQESSWDEVIDLYFGVVVQN